jgi:hypothetical protein
MRRIFAKSSTDIFKTKSFKFKFITMENALTFRFEGSDIERLVTGQSGAKYVHVTFYLELLEPEKKQVIMRAIMDGFTPTASKTGSIGGCPVPPCALAPSEAIKPECIQLGDQIAEANKP